MEWETERCREALEALSAGCSAVAWETEDGQKRSKLEVIADDIDFSGGAQQAAQASPQAAEDYYDEDVPF